MTDALRAVHLRGLVAGVDRRLGAGESVFAVVAWLQVVDGAHFSVTQEGFTLRLAGVVGQSRHTVGRMLAGWRANALRSVELREAA